MNPVKNRSTEARRPRPFSFSVHENKFSAKNNTRKLWNLIKCLSTDDEEKQIRIKNLKENDEYISNKRTIGEILNNFLSTNLRN